MHFGSIRLGEGLQLGLGLGLGLGLRLGLGLGLGLGEGLELQRGSVGRQGGGVLPFLETLSPNILELERPGFLLLVDLFLGGHSTEDGDSSLTTPLDRLGTSAG